MEEKETVGQEGSNGIGEASPTIGKLVAALSKAQGQMKSALKDSDNPSFESKYADLASVWDACRDPLSKNGLAVIQRSFSTDGAVIVLNTILAHESGEWISGTLNMMPVVNDPQGIGSCLTYARRYALSSMVGICPEDDDGNKASGAGKPKEAKAPPAGPTAAKPAEKPAGSPTAAGKAPKVATGRIMDVTEPNKGGYVSVSIEGHVREGGKPMKFSTREKAQIDAILDIHDAGEKLSVEYRENANPAFACEIVRVIRAASRGDAQE